MPTVLIVDDDRHARSLLERVFKYAPGLKKYELHVVQAGDGEEGLAVFDQARPDVVVCDLLMPRMDGFRFCAALRAREHGKAVGLIVTSGLYRDPEVAARVRDEFGGLFYAKPYQIRELTDAVEKLVSGRPVDDAGRAPGRAPTTPPGAPGKVGPLEGAFAATPVPLLLLDLHEGRATGSLELRRGRVDKRIDLVMGHPFAVASNQRQDVLGHFLVARRAITEEQHERALQRAQAVGEKLGESLVELGIMTSAQLVRFLTAQARHKITSTLRWTTGSYQYRPNPELLDRAKGDALDTPALVFLGLRDTARVDEASRACERVAGRRLALTVRGARLKAAFGRAFGDALAAAVVERFTLEDLLAVQPERGVVIPAIEALLLTRCAEPVGGRTSPTPPEGARALAEDSIALAELSTAPMTGRFRAAALPPRSVDAAAADAAPEALGGSLYDLLFGDQMSSAPKMPPPLLDFADAARAGGVPAAPLPAEQSGVVEMPHGRAAGPDVARPPADPEIARLREALLAEFLRIDGKDWYAVLEVARLADGPAIEAACAAKAAAFALEKHARFDLGGDYAKLEDLHAAYRRAREVLVPPEKRLAYDRQLGARAAAAPATKAFLDIEMAFREGERLSALGHLEEAVAQFRKAVDAQPDVADYHAALGWALFRRSRGAGGGAAPAQGSTQLAIAAAAHLAQALVIDPDHAAANEYSGRMLVDSDDDPVRAAEHLERALDASPPRWGALDALEHLWLPRGEAEHRRLERQYRTLLHRVGESAGPEARRLWLALASIYHERLHDDNAARLAAQCAARVAPDDPEVLATLDRLTAGVPGGFAGRIDVLRARWRQEPGAAEPGRAYFRAAVDSRHHDGALVAAGVLAARGAVDDEAAAYQRRFRPRFLQRALRPLDAELGRRLRHHEDDPDLETLYGALAPLAEELHPLSLADLDVRAADEVAAAAQPEPFARVLAYAAHMVGTAAPAVFVRADFGEQIHLGAVKAPVLLVGPAALAATDRADLAFRAARALSYLAPGRAVGGSRPSRVLKSMLIGAIGFSGTVLPAEDPSGAVARARAWIANTPPEVQHTVRDAVARIVGGREQMNLSRWARALARTADRVGLVVAGDVQAALRAAASISPPDAIDDLCDFALGADHLAIRAALGISLDV